MNRVLSNIRRHAGMGLLALLFLAPVVSLPFVGDRGLLLPILSVLLLTLLATHSTWAPQGVRQFFTNGANAVVLAFVAWAAIATLINRPQGFGAQLALQEFIKLAAGAGLYFAVVYQFGTRERLGILAHLMLAGGILAAVAGVSSFVATKDATGAFGNHQILAGFLVALFPIALSLAARGEMKGRRILAIVSLVSISGALMLTGNRVSWLAAAVSAVAVGALALTDPRVRESILHRRALVAPLVVAAIVAGLFFEFSGNRFSNNGISVAGRFSTVQNLAADTSVQNRVDLLGIASRMLKESPLTGYGLGSFHREAGRIDNRFTQVGNYEIVNRVGMSTMAHNEYAQTGAELGFIGIGLYMAILAVFFVRGVRTLSRIQSENRRWLLIAALGAMVAQSVDALGNPAWRFGEVSALFWMVLGLGIAVTRSHSERRAEPVLGGARLSFARPGVALAAAVLAVGVTSLSVAAGAFSENGPVTVSAIYNAEGLEINPFPLTFGIQRRSNVLTAQKRVTWRNKSGRTLTIMVSLLNNPTDRYFFRQRMLTFTLRPNQVASRTLIFRRNLVGTFDSGMLTVVTGGLNPAQVITPITGQVSSTTN